MALTADDARAIADGFLGAAEAIDKYLDDSWETITRPDYEILSESARTLLRVSGFMTTAAVGLSIEQMQDEAAELKQVIADAKEILARLQAVRTAIRVTAGLVDLATAIMAKDPGDVSKAVKGLHKLTRES
jgi:hypothetical protein